MASQHVTDIVTRLLAPPRERTEADLQGDIAELLLSGRLNLQDQDVVRREQQLADGTRRRIDVSVGHLIIEAKKDLNLPGVLDQATQQLHGYVSTRDQQTGMEHAAVLTDGRTWHLFARRPGHLEPVATLTLTNDPQTADQLIAWLDVILATRDRVPPTPAEVTARLGADSAGHEITYRRLLDLYEGNKLRPEIRTARALWSRLLRTAFGDAFDEAGQDDLFVRHSLLVLQSEAIAHAVVGFDLRDRSTLTPTALARGDLFRNAGIRGAVEADFFDWVVLVPGGEQFTQALIDRIAQFDFSSVQHDVMKVLYESVISADTRRALGEYYTPDWLAEQVVADAVHDPLNARVLDPACGSGTFLFHAVRAYLQAAQQAGMDPAEIPSKVAERVFGVDVHPVAVTLARVTYLMAIGHELLSHPDRVGFTVPVYVGDSLQWQFSDLFASDGSVVISTEGSDLSDLAPIEGYLQGMLDVSVDQYVPLRFPEALFRDAEMFDTLLDRFTDEIRRSLAAGEKPKPEGAMTSLGIHDDDKPILRETFAELVRLGGDPIWAYYARNLVRPSWLARPEHQVEVIVGNPPWLRYAAMTNSMQERYKRLAKERNLLSGSLGASGRDLSTLFLARAVELYLRDGGRFAMVMPQSVLHRRPHEGFRSGRWSGSQTGHLNVMFEEGWDLAGVEPLFPVPACVLRGTRNDRGASPLRAEVVTYSGRLRGPNLSWEQAQDSITVGSSRVAAITTGRETSAYSARFRQGAIFVPRRLLRVDVVQHGGPLGAGAGRVAVRSHISPQDKEPYKSMAPLEGVVERQYLHTMLLGESVAPFCVVAPAKAVLPLLPDRIMTADEVAVPAALSKWWNEVESAWARLRKPTESAALLERMDHMGHVSAQLPAAPYRVVYKKSGVHVDAAVVTDREAVIAETLYWAAVSSRDEADYLVGILNSAEIAARMTKFQAVGLFGPRHIDKYVWYTMVPTFDRADPRHQRVVAAARAVTELAETAASELMSVRARLEGSSQMGELERAVGEVLPAEG